MNKINVRKFIEFIDELDVRELSDDELKDLSAWTNNLLLDLGRELYKRGE